jgi:hypothetical protein
MTAVLAVVAPAAGFAIDHRGWQAGFVTVALVGAAVALTGALATSGRARARRATASDPQPTPVGR